MQRQDVAKDFFLYKKVTYRKKISFFCYNKVGDIMEKKQYEELLIEIINIQEDVIRTSTGNDTFDDGYQDPNLNFGS